MDHRPGETFEPREVNLHGGDSGVELHLFLAARDQLFFGVNEGELHRHVFGEAGGGDRGLDVEAATDGDSLAGEGDLGDADVLRLFLTDIDQIDVDILVAFQVGLELLRDPRAPGRSGQVGEDVNTADELVTSGFFGDGSLFFESAATVVGMGL